MEDAMVENHDVKRPATKRLPRWVYRLLVSAVAWFALAVWIFAGPAVTDYPLFVVSGFILAAAALVLILSQAKRESAEQGCQQDPPPFHDRSGWDLDIFQTRLSVSEAALQILLPLGTAAFGITAIGIVWHIAAHLGTTSSVALRTTACAPSWFPVDNRTRTYDQLRGSSATRAL
jgi:hypothetical protein